METINKLLVIPCLLLLGTFALQAQNLKPFKDEGKGKYGYKDKSKKVVILPKYAEARHFSEGLAIVADERGYHGFIDTTGKVIIHLRFNDAQDFRNGYAPVKENGKWGLADSDGHLVVPIRFDYVSSMDAEGNVTLREGDKTFTIAIPSKIK